MPTPDPVVVFPDTDLVLLDFLRAQLYLSDVEFGTELPSDVDDRLPFVRISRIGGGRPLRFVLDDSRTDVEARAATRYEAHRVIQTVLAALETAHQAVHDGALIYRVDIETGPSWEPDPLSDQPRWFATVNVRDRPAAALS